MAEAVAKRSFFSATIASAQNRPVELFQMVKSLLHAGPQDDKADHTVAQFAQHFAGEIAQICSDLDAVAVSGPVNVTVAPACPVLNG